MKKGGQLSRKTRLKSGKPLRRKTPLQAKAPLKSSGGLPRDPKPKRPRNRGESDPTWRINRKNQLRAFPWCEVGRLTDHSEPCERGEFHVHHVRNQGVGFRDHRAGNLLTLCWYHHDSRSPASWHAAKCRDEWCLLNFGVDLLGLVALVKETRGGEE